MYLKAIYLTLISMGPFYIENVFTWLKSAIIDAPYRVLLDVELERMRLERNEYLSGSSDEEEVDKKDA